MTANVFKDQSRITLNPFMTKLTGNLIAAIASSLKCPEGNHIEFQMTGDALELFVDGKEIPMNLGQAQKICNHLLRGLLLCLRGAEGGRRYRFVLEK